jgi:hypothetical protein
MIERRAQDDISRLARLVLRDQLEIIREAFIRRGKSEWVANSIVETTIEEFRNGDPGLLEIFREKSLH